MVYWNIQSPSCGAEIVQVGAAAPSPSSSWGVFGMGVASTALQRRGPPDVEKQQEQVHTRIPCTCVVGVGGSGLLGIKTYKDVMDTKIERYERCRHISLYIPIPVANLAQVASGILSSHPLPLQYIIRGFMY